MCFGKTKKIKETPNLNNNRKYGQRFYIPENLK